MFGWLCACPADELLSQWRKRMFILICVASFVIIFGIFVASLIYFTNYVSTDLKESLYGLCHAIGYITIVNMILVGFIYRKKISKLFTSFSDMMTASKLELKY